VYHKHGEVSSLQIWLPKSLKVVSDKCMFGSGYTDMIITIISFIWLLCGSAGRRFFFASLRRVYMTDDINMNKTQDRLSNAYLSPLIIFNTELSSIS
jgi:hypothetical protein